MENEEDMFIYLKKRSAKIEKMEEERAEFRKKQLKTYNMDKQGKRNVKSVFKRKIRHNHNNLKYLGDQINPTLINLPESSDPTLNNPQPNSPKADVEIVENKDNLIGNNQSQISNVELEWGKAMADFLDAMNDLKDFRIKFENKICIRSKLVEIFNYNERLKVLSDRKKLEISSHTAFLDELEQALKKQNEIQLEFEKIKDSEEI